MKSDLPVETRLPLARPMGCGASSGAKTAPDPDPEASRDMLCVARQFRPFGVWASTLIT